MFASDHAGAATLPRPTYPDVSRIVETADRRTRELAEAMLRLNAEHPDGCTETTLLIEGFSTHEQQQLGATAKRLANLGFVRQVDAQPKPPTDEDLIQEATSLALGLHGPLFDRLVIKLRARPEFNEDSLARIWPKVCTGLASRVARTPLPARL